MAADHDHDHGHDHGLIDDLARIEALRTEGVHRAGDHEGPFSLHVLGLGKTGADIITSIMKNPPEGFLSAQGTKFGALAVDIGDEDLAQVREAASDVSLRTVVDPRATVRYVSELTSRIVKLQGGLFLRAIVTTDVPVHAASPLPDNVRSIA